MGLSPEQDKLRASSALKGKSENVFQPKQATLRTVKYVFFFFFFFFLYSNANSSEVDSPKWLNFELIGDFMAALIIIKILDNMIQNESPIFRTTFSPLKVCRKLFQHLTAINSEAKCPICQELVPDCVPVLLICNFETMLRTRVECGGFRHPRARNSEVNRPIWPDSNLFQILCLF